MLILWNHKIYYIRNYSIEKKTRKYFCELNAQNAHIHGDERATTDDDVHTREDRN